MKKPRKRQPNPPIPPEQRSSPAYPVKRPSSAGRKTAPRARPR